MESKCQATTTGLEGEQNTVPVNRESETPKALLNAVVLQNIFKFLGYKDLKSCREVGNTTWLRNSKKAWWSRTKIAFTDRDWQTNRITDYLNETEINSNAINYKLEDFKDYRNSFWDSFGQSIKSLELWRCSFNSVDDFRHLIYVQCSNLENLAAHFVSIKAAAEFLEPVKWQKPRFGQNNNLKSLKFLSLEMSVSWMELLSHFPKLQFLEARVSNPDIFNAISIIRQHDPKMLKLKHIKIHTLRGNDYDQHIRSVLLDRSLSLETIQINYCHCQNDTVLDILELHAESLKEIYIQCEEDRNPVIELPRRLLLSLDKLSIQDCLFPADIFKYTPNVRNVFVCHNQNPSYNMLEGADPNLRLQNCKELTINVLGHSRDASNSDLDFYVNLCPSVEIFNCGEINNRQFSMVCERWTKLVSFTVYYGSDVDVIGLLGYDPDSKDQHVVRKPNITNLKDLQLFVDGIMMTVLGVLTIWHGEINFRLDFGMIYSYISCLLLQIISFACKYLPRYFFMESLNQLQKI